MRAFPFIVLLVVAGCSKKEETSSGPAAGSNAGSSAATPGSGEAAGSAPAAAAKPAPAVTGAMLVEEPPKWTIEAMDRGLWIGVDGGPLEHKCRVELGMAMGRFGKIRAEATKTPDTIKCESKGAFTLCSFTVANAAKPTPENTATWVFTADDDSNETVLVAVLLGSQGEWAAREKDLASNKKACPRPSQD